MLRICKLFSLDRNWSCLNDVFSTGKNEKSKAIIKRITIFCGITLTLITSDKVNLQLDFNIYTLKIGKSLNSHR